MSQTTVLDLENLTSQYSNLLIQYEQAVADYTSFMATQYSPGYQASLMNLPNKSFWGSESLTTTAGVTVAECSTLCLNNSKCTGATFNRDGGTCALRSGEGSIIPSSNNDVALVQKETYLLLNIQGINSQLLNINEKILAMTNETMPEFNSEYDERKVKSEQLLLNYIRLNKEREKISTMVKSYEELNQEEIQGNINISQNYSSFILLLILAVLLLVVLYIFSRSSSTSDSTMIPQQPTPTPTNMQGGQLGISTYFIVFIIIITVLVIKYFSNISSFIKSYY